jgi:accessory gene regulator protein AgrB
MKILNNIYQWLMCFLRKDCQYSIKKLFAILTFVLVVYLAVFTLKNYYELLMFVSVLLGISSYDKRTWNANNSVNNSVNTPEK